MLLTRNVGIVLIVFSLIVIGFTLANLVFLTYIKDQVRNRDSVNIYLSLTSVVLVLGLLMMSLSVILVIPESHWTRRRPAVPLDL
jgi:O-antigen/teichoic acid export membrane protein